MAERSRSIVAGEVVVSPAPSRPSPVGQDWPGPAEGLSERESEIVALITQGKTNAEIAALTHLSINTIKRTFAPPTPKSAANSRTQAAISGHRHGQHLETRRIETWRYP